MNKIEKYGMQMSAERIYKMGKAAQDKIWAKFCDDIIQKPIKPVVVKRKFKPHPSKVQSDSDVSTCRSAKLYPGWSSDSNVELVTIKVRATFCYLRYFGWAKQIIRV